MLFATTRIIAMLQRSSITGKGSVNAPQLSNDATEILQLLDTERDGFVVSRGGGVNTSVSPGNPLLAFNESGAFFGNADPGFFNDTPSHLSFPPGFADNNSDWTAFDNSGSDLSAAARIIKDTTAPRVTSFSPADGSINASLNTNITLTFDELVKAGQGFIEIHSGSATGALVERFDAASSSRLTFSGGTLTIDPLNDLGGNARYYVTLAKGTVKDLAGNSYSGTSTYDFKTVALDTVAPIVKSFTPVDGSLNVSLNTNITLTFSESIKAGSGFIEIHSDSATGALVESFDAASSTRLLFSGSTLTIDPLNTLSSDTHYFVTLVNGSVKDLAGNSYSGTSTYDFTTMSANTAWNSVSGYGLLNVDTMLEKATGHVISDASLYGDGWGAKDWGLNDIQAPDAWLAGYKGKGIIVAVVDTGVDYMHSDLSQNIWTNTLEIAGNGIDDDKNGYVDDIYGYDFINKDGYALDDNGHGTHVSGIIAGLNNGVGVTGVAYEATIMPVKVLDSSGSGSFTSVAQGVTYAVNNGADVINLSLGAYGASSTELSTAITYAINHGVIVCMASGNDSQTSPTYPAILAKTAGGIAVGAVNSSNVVATFSNDAGTLVPYDFVVAPGVSIYSSYIGGQYAVMSGTSMATPFVSGAAALLLSAQNDFSTPWSLAQLENLLTTTAQPVGATGLLALTSTASTGELAASLSHFDMVPDVALQGSLDSVDLVALTGVATVDSMGHVDYIL